MAGLANEIVSTGNKIIEPLETANRGESDGSDKKNSLKNKRDKEKKKITISKIFWYK